MQFGVVQEITANVSIANCRFPIANWSVPQLANRQSAFWQLAILTHPLPRGGTDVMSQRSDLTAGIVLVLSES